MDDEAAWLTIDEAAARRGTSVDAIRGLIRRGRLEHHKDNHGRVRVRLSPDERLAERLVDDGRQLTERLADAEAAAERWRRAAEERGQALARAEGENRVLREVLEQATVSAELVTTLKVEVARLEAEITAARRIAEAEIAAAKAETDAKSALVEELKLQAARERGRRHGLEAELRRPWWRKLLDR
jgi:excisionase family DNA binding protein